MGFLKPFLIPSSGYFQTISRLGAAISLLTPLQYAPLVFNLIAIFIEVLPALFFLSRRFEYIVSSFSMRFMLGLTYLILPSTFETHINLSNSQWRLAILMFMIIIVKESKYIWWKIFDALFLIIAGLSGPFSIVAFPVSLYYVIKTKGLLTSNKMFILSATAVTQLLSSAYEILHFARGQIILGASFANFFKILTGKILIGGILGSYVYRRIYKTFWWNQNFIPVILGLVGIVLLIYVIQKAQLELKLFVIYAFIIFGLSLIFPMVSSGSNLPEWDAMLHSSSGNRYFFLPMLAWILSLCWLYFRGHNFRLGKNIAMVMLLIFIMIGVPLDWKINNFSDYNFKQEAKRFEQAAPGQTMDITINPGWKMELHKK